MRNNFIYNCVEWGVTCSCFAFCSLFYVKIQFVFRTIVTGHMFLVKKLNILFSCASLKFWFTLESSPGTIWASLNFYVLPGEKGVHKVI